MLGNTCVEVHARQRRAEEDIGRILDNIKEMAAILDLVQCIECVHFRRDPHDRSYCSLLDRTTRDEGYCSWGERKTETET